MATFLRSLKFVRRLNLQGRRLGCSSTTHRTNTQLLRASRAQCALLQEERTYVTKPAYKTSFYNETNIDNLLDELDQRVRNYRGIQKAHIDQVLNAVTEKGSLTNVQALLLIRCCGEFLRVETFQTRNSLTDQIWEIIKELKVPIDVSHYNALLLVYLENERDFSPVDILMEMKTNKIEPNHVTFQRLIRQYCNKGDISGATKILEHMSEKEIPINENIFNSLIKGHSEAGDIPSAIKILGIMKNAGIEPSSRTYAETLCAYAKAGDVESIKSTFKQCKEQNIQLTDREILDVIYTLAINQHTDMIDEMITYLNKGGLYNKDAGACILKLIEKNCIDVAYKLLKTLVKPENQENFSSGGFFLRKLVTSGANPETMIKYCNLLKQEKLHNNPFELAIIQMFSHEKQHMALSIMKYWAETGAEIREHYFFPIFVAHSKDNNLQGLLNTLKTMVFDFKITPNISTIREYIVPFLIEDAFTNAQTLVNNHLPFSNVAHAISLHLLMQSKAKQAHDFITSTSLTYRLSMLVRPLTRALADTKDVSSIAGIVHHQYVLALKNQSDNSEDKLTAREFSSLIVSKIANDLPSHGLNLLTEFLQNLSEKGVSIDQKAAEQVKQRLGDKVNAEIESLLKELTSDSLEPKNIERSFVQKNGKINRSLKGSEVESPEFHKMLQVQQQIRNGEKEAVEESLSQLDQENIKYSTGFCATMIEYYSLLNNVEEATKWFNKLKEIGSDFKLNKTKILKYASLLVELNKIEEAIEALKYPVNDVDSNRHMLCEKLMEQVCTVCPEKAEEFIQLLRDQKLVSIITTSMFTPIVKGPLKAGDIEKAIEKYKWACENYKITPCKILIMSHLINNEDAKTLKYVTDLSTKVHGEVNSLIDLAVAFFECNRPHQARKILETPGLRLNRERMRMIVEKYYNYDEARLEGFIRLINGLFLDMDPFYVLLLKSYGKKDKWQQCLALWTQMQEDNIQPSVSFMEELERILKQCNQPVPFATSNQESLIEATFTSALLEENLQEADRIINEMLPSDNRFRYRIRLAEAYLNSNNIDETLSNTITAMDENPRVIESSSSFIQNIIEKLVEKDQFQHITKLFSKIQAASLKIQARTSTPYNKILNKCYLKQGTYNQFLLHLDKLLDDSNDYNINSLFHMTFNTSVLHQQPEYLESMKKLAYKAIKNNKHSPMNSLWAYYFIKDNPEAEVIYNEHLKNTDYFYGISAMYSCGDNGFWHKVPKIVEYVVMSKVNLSKKRNTLIRIFQTVMANDDPKKYEIAYECLRNMNEVVPIEQIQEKYINALKAQLPDNLSIESLKSENHRVKNEATG